jgi:hypothetical protein
MNSQNSACIGDGFIQKQGNPRLVCKGFHMSETKEPAVISPTQIGGVTLNNGVATIGVSESGFAFGTNNPDIIEGLASQIINAASKGPKPETKDIAFMSAIAGSIHPRDTIETLLVTQMAAVHNATMTFARRLNHVDNIKQQDSASRAFNQLARTFAAQVEALKRHRNGGNQNMTVKHVHVHEGGQAIVGDVHTGKRANENQ